MYLVSLWNINKFVCVIIYTLELLTDTHGWVVCGDGGGGDDGGGLVKTDR